RKWQHEDILGITAARRLEAGGDARSFILLALGESPMPARMTPQAGNVMMQGHALPDAKTPHATADLCDRPGCFMAKNPRRRDRAILDLFDVSRTNTTRRHLYQDFICGNSRHRHRLKPQIVAAAINDSLHPLRKRKVCF